MVSQSGGHQKWRHENGRQVIVVMPGGKTIPIGTLKLFARVTLKRKSP